MSRLGIGIHLGLEREDLFANLVNQSQVIGSDVALTNVSTGTRQSAASDGAVRLANTVDSVSRGGIPMAFSMAAATNLVDTVISSGTWAKLNATVNPNGYEYDVTTTDANNQVKYTATTVASTAHTFRFECKKGTKTINKTRVYDATNAAEISYTINGGASGSGSRAFDSEINTSTFSTIDVQFTTPVGCLSVFVFLSSSDSIGSQCVKDVRLVALSAPAAGFADGTGAAEVYAVDLLSCAPTWPSVGTIVQAAIPYGYSGGNQPTGAPAYGWLSPTTPPMLGYIDATTGKMIYSAITATTFSAGAVPEALSTSRYDWNGTNANASYNDEAQVVILDSTVPSGTLYIGNRADGTRPFHGGLATLIFPWVLTDAEYEIVRVGLNNLFSTVEFN